VANFRSEAIFYQLSPTFWLNSRFCSTPSLTKSQK